MSGLLIKNRFVIKNLRKSFRYLSSCHSAIRVTNPRLLLITRHQRCFSNLALKSNENVNHKENSENLSNGDAFKVISLDTAIADLDGSARRTGRIGRHLVEKAFSLCISPGETISSMQSLFLLRSCGLMLKENPDTRVKLVDEIWQKLQKLGCNYDIRHYNSLLKIYVECNHQFLPSDFLMKLETNNVEPNRVTFLHLMEKYCNDGDLNGASEILEYMKEKGFSVNENVFSTLITGHMRINDVSGAMEIFDIMRSSNLTPTNESYLALACGHARNGNIEGVKSAIKDAERNGVGIATEDYLSILSSIQSDDHLHFLAEVIDLLGSDIMRFKQDILNCAFNLIDKGACDSAYHLILSISTQGESARLCTNNFLNHLAKTNQPVEKMFKFLDDITGRNLNVLAWLNCAKSCIDVGQIDKAFAIFSGMIEKGITVRIHHFHPIFTMLKSEKEIFEVLKNMYNLGLPADNFLYINCVFPAIDVSDPERVLKKIEETGQSKTAAYDPLFMYYTHNGQCSNAWHLAKNYPIIISSDFNMKKFLSTHSEASFRDAQSSFHEVLSFIMKNIGKRLRLSGDLEGKILADLISFNQSAFLFWAKRAKEEGFQPSGRTFDVCYKILSERNPKLINHLNKLVEVSSDQQSIGARNMTVEEEEKYLQNLLEKGYRTDLYMQQRLQHHAKNKNIDRINYWKGKLNESNATLTPLTLSRLFYFHKDECDFEEAHKYLRTLKEKFPDFDVDSAQILEFASLLVKFSKFDDAMDVLKAHCNVIRINGSRDFLYRANRKFFEGAIESGNIDFMRNAQSHLLTVFNDKQYAKMMHEPLVKMHLYRNSLEDAVKEFRSIVNDKKVAPYTSQLMKRCIVADDHQMLETVIEAASSLEGKIPVLQELSMAFMELNRNDQAAKVLENLGRKIQPSFLTSSFNKLYSDKNVSKLECFLYALKGIDGVDLSKGISYLIKLYDVENDAQRALNMCNELKDIEMDIPTERLLMNLLKRNNVVIPSHVLETKTVPKESKLEDSNVEFAGKPTDPIMGEFHDLLEKGDALPVLEKLDSLKKGHIRSLAVQDMTKLVSLALENKLDRDLERNVQAMSHLIENAEEVMKPILINYSESGELELLHHITNLLPDFTLKAIAFNGYLSRAYLVCGKPAELLTEMENRVDKKNKIFSSTTFFELLSNPDLRERALNLAERYYESKFSTPIDIVWAHHLIHENYDAAEELEKKYKIEGEKADSIILRVLRKNENVTLGRKYINNLIQYNARLRHKEKAYGTLLDVLVLKEMYDEAVNLVVESKEKQVILEKHFHSTLVTLKTALERENKPVPFTIPSEESIISA